ARACSSMLKPDAARLPFHILSSRFEKIRELVDCEDALPLVFLHQFRGHPVQEAEAVLFFGLCATGYTEGTEGAMLIQYDGRGISRRICYPGIEGIDDR